MGFALVVMVTAGGLMARTVTVAVTAATRAVTTVSRVVVRLVRASPVASLRVDVVDSEPLSAEKTTGAPGNGLPLTSVTTAMI